MHWFKWAGLIYFIFILSYLLNVLITELPLDDRYQKLKLHFTFRRFFHYFITRFFIGFYYPLSRIL